jgi:glycosyltransferase involved in cell wall biosynthesis|tara:strand:+ start:86 stop:712 length:627 start_codon:yes stop_codon:yes gene_type:complete
MKSISYAITCWNEIEELTKLLNFLQLHIRKEDEIVIQYDKSSVTDEVKQYVTLMNSMHENHIVVGFSLNKDFATFKNNLKSHCTKDYIFQVDADEIPHEYLVEYLGEVLETNPVDIVFVPRVNTVEGLEQSHIDKWKWNVNDKGWVNFPDYQTRIYRNTEDVTWMNKVHERITGYDTFSNFPAEEQWSLYHHKQIDRQEKQNEFYETI